MCISRLGVEDVERGVAGEAKLKLDTAPWLDVLRERTLDEGCVDVVGGFPDSGTTNGLLLDDGGVFMFDNEVDDIDAISVDADFDFALSLCKSIEGNGVVAEPPGFKVES
jgi:hypothetical protein